MCTAVVHGKSSSGIDGLPDVKSIERHGRARIQLIWQERPATLVAMITLSLWCRMLTDVDEQGEQACGRCTAACAYVCTAVCYMPGAVLAASCQ